MVAVDNQYPNHTNSTIHRERFKQLEQARRARIPAEIPADPNTRISRSNAPRFSRDP